ncbi:unnamed protein product [Vitrella brassicaformis CCMP3155]|uniref:Uncharacterized protein n=2 Tax=Vitrella brassicaformis TaxID=1169539 RepID=A0A0G4FZX8_VITBC|nr:unnamed protein product [Vitrella brassicaformis CCMP3155]|eukprot:CEM21188.1 unnamed protein product [Vitrella brassicaformis CCMP3155]
MTPFLVIPLLLVFNGVLCEQQVTPADKHELAGIVQRLQEFLGQLHWQGASDDGYRSALFPDPTARKVDNTDIDDGPIDAGPGFDEFDEPEPTTPEPTTTTPPVNCDEQPDHPDCDQAAPGPVDDDGGGFDEPDPRASNRGRMPTT